MTLTQEEVPHEILKHCKKIFSSQDPMTLVRPPTTVKSFLRNTPRNITFQGIWNDFCVCDYGGAL